MMKKLIIVSPCYNEEETLLNSGRLLKTIIEELISEKLISEDSNLLLVDDGSTDRTYKIINSFKNNKIKVFQNQKNIGLTKSLNILIKNSNGDYIARQDSDDISLHNRLDKQYNFMHNKNLDACTTRAYIRNSKNSIPRFSHLLPTDWVIKYK
ncbi:MAG: glycosyltransferase family A protein, partial [Deltaproteobacteria bacterium]